MGLGIFLIAVGVLVGGGMAASPRRMWWATRSWKYRNPTANEPSDTAYGLTRVSGVLFLICALAVGGVFIGNAIADKRKHAAQAEEKKAAEAAFVVPPPEKRGLMPVIGYFAEPTPGTPVTVYYLAPGFAVEQYVRTMSDEHSYPCYASPRVTPAGADRITVAPELIWAPEHPGDMSKADHCRPRAGLSVRAVSVDDATADTSLVTDAAIVNRDGTQIRPAAPGNPVPRLSEKLRTDR